MSWDDVLEETKWKEKAECRDADTEVFFGNIGSKKSREKRELALTYCNKCRVREECIMFSLRSPNDNSYRDPRNINNHLRENVVLEGIWGGLDSFQRAALMRRMKRARMENIGKPRKFWEELTEAELRRNKKQLRVKRKGSYE